MVKSIKKEERNHDTWLANYQGHSLKQYRRAWGFWEKYVGDKNESWILANKDTEDWAKHLVNFHRWLKQQPKERGSGILSDNTAKVMANGIRGYFKHIGITPGLNKVQKTEITNVESTPTMDWPFNLKTKERLLSLATEEEEYVVSAGVSFGLRVGDFRRITRGMLEPLLDREVPIQLPEIITKKERIKAYPFIDRDAYGAIKRLLEKMNREGRTDPSERMMPLTSRQINNILKKAFEKVGVNVAEYTIRFHILRKFLTNELANVCAGDKWKTFVGKKTNTPYVGPEGREAYKKVMEFTNVNGERIRESSAKIEQLERQVREYRQQFEVEIEDLRKIDKRLDKFVELVEKLNQQTDRTVELDKQMFAKIKDLELEAKIHAEIDKAIIEKGSITREEASKIWKKRRKKEA